MGDAEKRREKTNKNNIKSVIYNGSLFSLLDLPFVYFDEIWSTHFVSITHAEYCLKIKMAGAAARGAASAAAAISKNGSSSADLLSPPAVGPSLMSDTMREALVIDLKKHPGTKYLALMSEGKDPTDPHCDVEEVISSVCSRCLFFRCPFANFQCDFPPTHLPPDCKLTGGINDLSCLFNLTISSLILLVQGAGHIIISFLTVFRIRLLFIFFFCQKYNAQK